MVDLQNSTVFQCIFCLSDQNSSSTTRTKKQQRLFVIYSHDVGLNISPCAEPSSRDNGLNQQSSSSSPARCRVAATAPTH